MKSLSPDKELHLLGPRNVIGVLLVTAITVSIWFIVVSREPHYLGHPISYWTEPFHHHGTESPEREAAAFAAMDERAVRWLARQLDWRPSSIKEGVAKIMNSLIGDFMPGRDYDGARRSFSIRALARLGPRARSAIPALEAASRTTVQLNQTAIRAEALGALIRVREDPVAPYIERLQTATGAEWAILCYALAMQGTNAAAAAPILASAVTNVNAWHHPTVIALGSIRSHPEVSVPALIRCLQVTNRIEQLATAEALGNFGPQASAAWPVLLNCVSNSNKPNGVPFKRALKRIDPQRATELGF